jgi:hypothetical protein
MMAQDSAAQPYLTEFHAEILLVTDHALWRFTERWRKQFPDRLLKDPREKIENLLAEAVEERLDPVIRVKRLIANDFIPAQYFYTRGWRFIVSILEGIPVLLTIERDIFGFERRLPPWKPPKTPRRLRKQRRRAHKARRFSIYLLHARFSFQASQRIRGF